MAGLLDDILGYGRDVAQGASNSIAGNVSAPVDGLAWLLRKAGVPMPSNPVGGSDWMRQKGLTAEPQNRTAGLLGDFLGMAGPMVAAAKAPQIASGLLGMADNLAAPRTLSKQAGVFIGPGAKTWNADAAARAKALADAGTDARQVWSQTGTWKGPDGMMRQEIPDNAAFYRGSSAAGSSMAEDVYLHPSLYDAYPKFGTSKIVESPHSGGSFDPRNGNITVGPTGAGSTTAHEFQHAIQQREGWASGGSPGANGLTWDELSGEGRKLYENSVTHYDDPILKELFQGSAPLKPWAEMNPITRAPYIEQAQDGAYRRLAGEAEARATEARIPLDAAQRRALFPEDSYDVPLNQLIIRR